MERTPQHLPGPYRSHVRKVGGEGAPEARARESLPRGQPTRLGDSETLGGRALVRDVSRREPNSVLAALVANPGSLHRNQAGEVILDLDPDAFGLALAWLRGGSLPRDLTAERADNLRALASVLRLEALASAVQDTKRKRGAVVTVVHTYAAIVNPRGLVTDHYPSEVAPQRVQDLLREGYQLSGTDAVSDKDGRLSAIVYHLLEK